MRRFLFLALLSCMIVCCTKSPSGIPDEPPINNPIDTTKPGGGKDTSTNGPITGGGINDSSGVTILRGIDGSTLFYHSINQPTACYSSDEYGTTLNLQQADTGKIRTKLVNSHKGSLSITSYTAWNGITSYNLSFSNINGEYFTNADIEKPDTAGKLQIWVYRPDGKDIVPAKPGQSAVNKIIHMIGTFPANVVGEGTIKLSEFPHPQSRITPAYMDSVFANAKWYIYKFNRRP